VWLLLHYYLTSTKVTRRRREPSQDRKANKQQTTQEHQQKKLKNRTEQKENTKNDKKENENPNTCYVVTRSIHRFFSLWYKIDNSERLVGEGRKEGTISWRSRKKSSNLIFLFSSICLAYHHVTATATTNATTSMRVLRNLPRPCSDSSGKKEREEKKVVRRCVGDVHQQNRIPRRKTFPRFTVVVGLAKAQKRKSWNKP